MNNLGFIGSFLLAVCGIAYAVEVWDSFHPGTFFWMWYLGEVFCLIYVIVRKDWPLVMNYLTNTAALTIIIIKHMIGE